MHFEVILHSYALAESSKLKNGHICEHREMYTCSKYVLQNLVHQGYTVF